MKYTYCRPIVLTSNIYEHANLLKKRGGTRCSGIVRGLGNCWNGHGGIRDSAIRVNNTLVRIENRTEIGAATSIRVGSTNAACSQAAGIVSNPVIIVVAIRVLEARNNVVGTLIRSHPAGGKWSCRCGISSEIRIFRDCRWRARSWSTGKENDEELQQALLEHVL